MGRLSILSVLKLNSGFFLSNEACDLSLNQISTQFSPETYLSNEVGAKDNWVQIAPYGDAPNSGKLPDGRKVIVIQRFQKEDADRIVSTFNSVLSIGTRIAGIPFYIGHPDDSSLESKYPDSRAYGRIKAIESRNDGLYANVKWSEAGKSLINEGFYHGHSVHWNCHLDQASKICRPIELKSVGFTNKPNLPVTPITTANEKPENIMDKALLIAALALSNDATDEQILTAINESKKAKDALTATKTELSTATTANADLTGKLALANTRATTAETALTASNAKVSGLETTVTTNATALVNEKAEKVKAIATVAIGAGKITAAERTTVETTLSNEATFKTEVDRLAKAPAKVKTVTAIDPNRGKGVANETGLALSNAVKAIQKDNPNLSYDESWAMARTKHPEFFTTGE